MYCSPISLQERCVEVIVCNLEKVFMEYYDICYNFLEIESNLKKYKHRHKELFLHNFVAEKILLKLGEKGMLNDSTISLFTEKNTRLKHVSLKNADNLFTEGLKILKGHKIVQLDCSGIDITLDDIIASLSAWSIENLETLNISNLDLYTHKDIFNLMKLKKLKSLNISQTDFIQHCFEIACTDLKNLEKLDISGTLVLDIYPLINLKNKLESLTIRHYGDILICNFIATVIQLENLTYLDISLNKNGIITDTYFTYVNELIEFPENLPNLIFLDLSGIETIQPKILISFVKKHKNLTFLGLVQSSACCANIFTNENDPEYNESLIVAGTATEKQLKVALRRYSDRIIYVERCLFDLFNMAHYFNEARPDIIELILPGIKNHPNELMIQMAAIICFHLLTTGEYSQNIHSNLLKQIVDLTVTAMRTFPYEYPIQKNSLIVLCNEKILKNAPNKFECAKMAMHTLWPYNDEDMNQMAVQIFNYLSVKITIEEKNKLGSNVLYMRKLLQMVDSKMKRSQIDVRVLNALWNLTDESAISCKLFLEKGGLNLFLKILDMCPSDRIVNTEILGLINNIAEVSKLRKQLMKNNLIMRLKKLLHSKYIEVSYFAGGIISHLASDENTNWTVINISRETLLQELTDVMSNWKMPDGEMVAYRSFKPFFQLLKRTSDYPIQLWAVWAMNYLCTKYTKHYCTMLQSEGGVQLLQDILINENTHPNIKYFVNLIIDLLHENT